MTQRLDAEGWPARLAATVAQEIRRHRKRLGLSAQQLADRCSELGHPINRSVLANMESGRRTSVGVAELLVLAKALSVPPGVLLFPVGYESKIEVLPGIMQEPSAAIWWFFGGGFDVLDKETKSYIAHAPLGLFRKHDVELQGLKTAAQEFSDRFPNGRPPRDEMQSAEERHHHLVSLFAEALDQEGEAMQLIGTKEDAKGEALAAATELRKRRERLDAEKHETRAHLYELKYEYEAATNMSKEIARRVGELLLVRERIESGGYVLPDLPDDPLLKHYLENRPRGDEL